MDDRDDEINNIIKKWRLISIKNTRFNILSYIDEVIEKNSI